MPFQPRCTITHRLLANVKRIGEMVTELNSRVFPETVLFEFEADARAVSAYASTSIEGNPLPLTEVRRILKSKPQHVRDSEREVLNYNQALENIDQRLREGKVDLDIEFLLSVHSQVMEGLMPGYRTGQLRTEPVFVNDPRTGQTIYWPPDSRDVLALLEQLLAFANERKDRIDPLIVAGIFHKQFVVIHPFMDGNGRTARLATKVLLAQMGIETFNLFSFENYYNRNVTSYFRMVGVHGNYYDIADAIDFTEWLEYFTEGIIDELMRVEKQLATVTIGPDAELKPYHRQILGYISEKGYITDREYAKLTERAKATRSKDFRKLVELGIIVRLGKGRATYYKLKQP